MIKKLKQWMKRRVAVAYTSLLERAPIDAEVGRACTYFRHDFRSLPSHERKEMMFEAELWLIAWKKVNEDSSNSCERGSLLQ